MNAKLIKFHKDKLRFHKQANYELRHTLKRLKIGSYRESYNKEVLRHREAIKFHTEAILYLEGLDE